MSKLSEIYFMEELLNPLIVRDHLQKKKDGNVWFCVDYRNWMMSHAMIPIPCHILTSLLKPYPVWSGSQPWIWRVATGRWRWMSKTGIRRHFPLEMAYGSSLSCRLDWSKCTRHVWEAHGTGPGWTTIEYCSDLSGWYAGIWKKLSLSRYRISVWCSTDSVKQKCYQFQKEVKYMGHIVSEKGIAIDLEKVEAVRSWSTPISMKEHCSFIGLC